MDDIAIVGMSCLFPGAPGLAEFWQNIVDKRLSIGEPPEDWGGHYSFDPASKENDRIYCARGGYLGDLSRFDPLRYGIMPTAVDGAEPEHFLALRVADEALRDAGFPEVPINKERTEVILGRGTYVNRALMNLHQHGFVIHQTLGLIKELMPGLTESDLAGMRLRLKEKLPPFDPVTAPGIVSSIMSGRIANRLDLKGPNYTIDAACASSLLAVDYAIRDLRSGRCDAAIAGGVQLSANNLVLMVFSQLGALTRGQELRPFDAGADGTMLGEGVGMVVLKRRGDAERDGNRIYALLKEVGTSSDGRAKSVVAPRPEGEELAIRRAYEEAGIDPSTIGLVEAHGTAIPLGDVTEIQSLKNVFGPRTGSVPGCAIGTVKSMIGHLIPASGIAGLIKTALALHTRVLPPTICERPNPDLSLEDSPFYINTETRPWLNGKAHPRRAAINAFGFGGINAHAILEEYAGDGADEGAVGSLKWDTELIVLSADSAKGLIEEARRLLGFISRAGGEHLLKDIAYTVNTGEGRGRVRLSVIASNVEELAKKLEHAIGRLEDPECRRIRDRSGIFYFAEPLTGPGRLAFVFPGEGSQYVNMLKDLCIHFPEVRGSFDLVDRVFGEEGMERPLSGYVYPPPGGDADDGSMWQMEVAVQSVTTANRALFKLLGRLGVSPDAVVGHSSGEFGALEAAGAVALPDDTAVLRYVRGGIASVKGVSADAKAIEEVTLLAAGSPDRTPVERVEEQSSGAVRVAMDNCPYQIIICCAEGAAEKAKADLAAAGVTCTTLPFNRAYHTPAFEKACGPLREFFGALDIVRPHTRIYSCATASVFPDTSEEIRATAVGQWARAVRFRDTIEAMYEDGARIFVEVGPGGNLTAFVNDILRGRQFVATPSNVKHLSGVTALNHALGVLAAHGVEADLGYLYERRAPVRLDLDGDLPKDYEGAWKGYPKLNLTLPMLSFDAGEAGEFSSGPAAPDTVPVHEPQDEARAGMPFSATSAQGPGHHGGRAAVMEEYFASQERFIESQEEVMTAYLRRKLGSTAGVADPVGAAPEAVAPAFSGLTATAAPEFPATLPFIGEVEIKEPGSVIEVTRTLDVEEDLFILDHVLAGKVSMTDPGLHGLAVMPLTMSMEMMAEAASVLFPGKKLVGMKDLRAYRWLALEEGRLAVKMHVRRTGADRAHVAVTDAGLVGEAPDGRLLEGEMIFADGYDAPPAARPAELKDALPSRFTPERMYATGMFNGPSFQAIERVATRGSNGAVATLKGMPTDKLFKSNSAPGFLTDPVILDAAGQVAAHWNAEASSSGFNFFPYRFAELNIYGPNPAPGEAVECRLFIEPTGQSTYSSDIFIISPDDKVLMEIKGWEDKSFDLPETFYAMRHGSPEVVLGSPWKPVAGLAGGPDSYECRRIAGFPSGLLTGHGRIWMKVLAFQILSAKERERWAGFTEMTDKRRVEWLLGRAAAKDAVRALMERKAGLKLCPADIEIDIDPRGRPVVVAGPWTVDAGGAPSVSIAHAGGMAVAIAALGTAGAGIGIDIEPLRELDEGVVEFMASGEELELFAGMQDVDSGRWGLRLWCAKEAAAKALGTGLGGRPKNLVARHVEAGSGTIELEVAGGLPGLNGGGAGTRLKARTIVEDGTVAAVSEYRRRV